MADRGRRPRPQRRAAPAVRRRHVRRRDVLRVGRLPRAPGRGVRRRRPGCCGRAGCSCARSPTAASRRRRSGAGWPTTTGSAGDRAAPTSSSAAAFAEPTLAHCNPGAPGDPLYAAWAAAPLSRRDAARPGWPRPTSSPAGPARGSWPGASRSPSRSGRRSATRRTGAGRSPASATRRRASSCSGWRRRPTAPTAPGGCSPATAAATCCSRAMHRAGLANQPTSAHAGDGLRAARRLGHGGGEVRPAGQPPDAGRARRVRAVPAAASWPALDPAVVVCLGAFGYEAACRTTACGPGPGSATASRSPVDGGPVLLCSFHPSQQNTFTGRLTEPMLDAVFARAAGSPRVDRSATTPSRRADRRPSAGCQPWRTRVCTASATMAWAVRQSSSRPNIEKKPWIWPSKRTWLVGTPASASRAA